jgi:hypothetical protein
VPSPDVRFTPKSDRLLRGSKVTLCAISDQSAVQQNPAYSITSSASATIFWHVLAARPWRF